MNLEKGEQLLVMAVLATSAACACPPAPAPAGASAPRHEPRPPVHAEGAHHPGHGGAHGPLVHEFKEGPEHWRKRFEEPGRDASQKPAEVVKAMGLAPGMAVADVGAGTGYFMRHLALAVGETGRVYAVDIEPSMVRYLKQRASESGWPQVEARLALTDDPLLPNASVDRILIVNTWHHIAERKAYAAKLHAALRPGGEVWIIDFTPTTDRGPPKEHRVAPAVVLEELEAGGFEARVDEALLPDQYIAIGR